jgi:hypothetical protein|tara:strand:- start:747 stop:944 length:198 start_codon:yes stop_codon:yes gene_type:complete
MKVVEVAGPCPVMISNKEATVYDKICTKKGCTKEDLSEREKVIAKHLAVKGIINRINGTFYPSFR